MPSTGMRSELCFISFALDSLITSILNENPAGDKNRSPYRLILIKLHSMGCSRETVWKVMSDTDRNFLNELVILLALGGEQRH